jgi:hypothetical protein
MGSTATKVAMRRGAKIRSSASRSAIEKIFGMWPRDAGGVARQSKIETRNRKNPKNPKTQFSPFCQEDRKPEMPLMAEMALKSQRRHRKDVRLRKFIYLPSMRYIALK